MKKREQERQPVDELPIGEVMWFLVARIGTRHYIHHAFEVVDGCVEPLSVCGAAELERAADEPYRDGLPEFRCAKCSAHFEPCEVGCTHPEHQGERTLYAEPTLSPPGAPSPLDVVHAAWAHSGEATSEPDHRRGRAPVSDDEGPSEAPAGLVYASDSRDGAPEATDTEATDPSPPVSAPTPPDVA